MNHRSQVTASGQWRCRMPNLPPAYPFRPVRFPSTLSSYSHRAPRLSPACIPRTLTPLPPPMTFSGFPCTISSTSCGPRLPLDAYRPAFSRTSQQQNESFFPYSSGPPTIGTWSDRLLHGKDVADGDRNRPRSSDLSRCGDDDPLESFLTYLNDTFPDMSDFEQPAGCRLSIQDKPLTSGLNDVPSSKGALEWDEDCIAFNESLALKEPDQLDPIPAHYVKDNDDVERIFPRKIKQSWIKSSQLDAEREAQSSGRPLRLEWPVPVSGSRTSYSWGPYFILAPFWIDVNHRSVISEASNCFEDADKKHCGVEEAVLCAKNCSSRDKKILQLSLPTSNRKKRKQAHPRKSPPLIDPQFKGVTLNFQTSVRKDSSQLFIQHSYSNIPRKIAKRHRRKRSRETLTSSDSGSDMDEPFLCQDEWVSCCPGKQCASCGAKKTPLWRDAEDGTPLCNACGIRYKKYRLRCPQCWHIPRKDGKSHSRCGCCGANLR